MAQDGQRKAGRRRKGRGVAPLALDAYLADLGRVPMLTRAEELALGSRLAVGDAAAREALVRGNLRFAVSVAKRYQNRGVPLPDLISEANVGLLRAAETFDPSRGVRFISYTVHGMRRCLADAVRETPREVRVPASPHVRRVQETVNILRRALGREPHPDEIADVAEVSLEAVTAILAATAPVVSLDAPGPAADAGSLLERLTDDEAESVEDEVLDRCLADDVDAALGDLPDRLAMVLRLYFGLGENGRMHTLEEIGVMLGVSRERVRQLRDQALQRIRSDGRLSA